MVKSQTLSISFAECERRPQPFGWKVEYDGNKVHITPRETVIKTNLTLQKTVIETTYQMHAVDLQYEQQMIEAFYQAFADSVEFCDWKKKDIQKHAEKNIHDYFAAKRGQPLTQSVLVLEPKTAQLLGLALFVITRKQRYKLDLLLVRPDYQRQGLATAMVSHVTSQLYEMGIREVYSLYHICNETSRNWHQKFGFQEKHDVFFIRLKLAWYREEIRRQELLGLTEDLPELIKQRDYWAAQLADENLKLDFWWDDE